MDALRAMLNYLSNLEWTERKQHVCNFCNEDNFSKIVRKNTNAIAVENRRKSGEAHWLIMPTRHIRDIEALTEKDIPLLQAMEQVKQDLLKERYPDILPSEIHGGYRRGRRQIIGSIICICMSL
ncbi:hypothetical protein BDV97DRAFT_362809 [Delphinella strobiligena]|nr:hypothetical protein BDV97DRAFT_362809 [Delphinella strobiligena]